MPKITKKSTKKTTTKRNKSGIKIARKTSKKPRAAKTVVLPVQAAPVQSIDRLSPNYDHNGDPSPETVVAQPVPLPEVPKRKPGRPRKVKPAYVAPSPELAASMNGGGIVIGELNPEQPTTPVVAASQKAYAESDGKMVVMSLSSEQETPDTTQYTSPSLEMKNGVLVLNVDGDNPQ